MRGPGAYEIKDFGPNLFNTEAAESAEELTMPYQICVEEYSG
jgi:hypothetical protein